jgi:hypothetical protein
MKCDSADDGLGFVIRLEETTDWGRRGARTRGGGSGSSSSRNNNSNHNYYYHYRHYNAPGRHNENE